MTRALAPIFLAVVLYYVAHITMGITVGHYAAKIIAQLFGSLGDF